MEILGKEIVENELIVYTDGASKNNPRRGGIGYRYILPDFKLGKEVFIDEWEGHFVQATNNQMELMASIKALENCTKIKGIEKVKTVTVCTDSKYLQNHIKYAKYIWPTKHWLTSTGVPVENDDLWKRLTKVLKHLHEEFGIKVEFNWVKAHLKGKKKDLHNDVADQLAKKGRDSAMIIPFRYVDVRRKLSNKSTKKGSVKIQGQIFVIRVLGCERKKTNKIYKIRYEVISKDSPFYECLDFIYSEQLLMEGHYYEVCTKMQGLVPMISEVIREVEEALKKNQKEIP